MIVYPENWNREYKSLAYEVDSLPDSFIDLLIEQLYKILIDLNVNYLSYSGGIDSTILLCLLSRFTKANTFTISSRKNHPDIIHAEIGCNKYHPNTNFFIVEPDHKDSDTFKGDNVVRMLFEKIGNDADKILCGDGVDEFMCGYYAHQNQEFATYRYYLDDLLEFHLLPLNNNSKNIKVYLPYLDERFVTLMRLIPLKCKVDVHDRKKIMIRIAQRLNIPEEIINRNKYGFCDAFLEKDK